MSPKRIILFPPAKVNLGLQVLAPRPDGYHEVQTIYQMIDLKDHLTLEARPQGIELVCDHPGLSMPTDNLAYRAAQLLAERAQVTVGARITLEKQIPLGAGLGGGSSNAAAALWGLNRLWEVDLDQPALLELAGRLGSDVPFFLFAPRSYATGRGELLERLPSSHQLWWVLLYPNFPISTAWAYAAYDQFYRATLPGLESDEGVPWQMADSRPQEGAREMATLRTLLEGGREAVVGPHLWNSLEAPVGAIYPAIFEMKRALLAQGATGTLMSGSGSTVFGLFPSRSEAEAAQRALSQERDWSCFSGGTILDLGEVYWSER
ncbi:MAG: 4-(cytidine 5'-diphospho)-2-C-methyl-D-erythritol kinase [Candidatus Tectomicrobia bacterium]|uniref:4-diphosphocytidyl-2-C-methyl-D-erythritol kinase n=1 Tax=Tectimicrobiota bacterium TaxID=2528274 RepID=A0A932CNW9_UNCTE|nr:4-(cytidine 5'-diphospho)-2-C-methyl-D-erythritol kinase [Candidatus Tectomicrobia bacterium]